MDDKITFPDPKNGHIRVSFGDDGKVRMFCFADSIYSTDKKWVELDLSNAQSDVHMEDGSLRVVVKFTPGSFIANVG